VVAGICKSAVDELCSVQVCVWVIKKQYTIWYEVRYANRGRLFHEGPIDRSIIMVGQLKDKEIRELVSGARDGIGDLIKEIEEDAIKQHGKTPFEVNINIVMDEVPVPPFVKSETDTSKPPPRCYTFCVTYGQSRRCYTICR